MLLVVLAVLVLGYCVGVLFRSSDSFNPFLDGWLGIAVEVTAVVVCFRAVMRTRSSHWQVVLGAAAVAVYCVGDLCQLLLLDGTGVPLLSVADVAYVAFYPLMLGALMVMTWKLKGLAWPLLLDSIVSALSAASIMALFLVPIIVADVGDATTFEVIVNVIYPCFDLLLITAVSGVLAARSIDLGPRWPLLGAGLIAFCAADVAYALGMQEYTVGSVIDIGWVAGISAIAVWVDGTARTDTTFHYRYSKVPDFLAPVLSTVSALVVLVLGIHRTIPVLAEVLAVVTLALAAVPLVFRNRLLATQATTDELTGLPNRRALLTNLPSRLHRGRPGALLLMDLDRFKHVNDALGHDVGDALLVQVGERFKAVLRSGDFLARLGGDEFAVFLDHVSGPEATAIAERLNTTLKKPIEIGTSSLQISTSIGIALTPTNGTDLSLLMRKADIAMFRAKRERSGHHAYTSTDRDDGVLRLQTIQELRTAFAEDQFELHYQPKVHLSDHGVAGMEALIRWNHPVRGQLPPVLFLDLVEEAGLQPELSTLVLEHAVRRMASWRADGLDVTVAINLSSADITEGLLPRILALLKDHHVPPESLMLEITEDILMSDPDGTARILRELRLEGIQTSIDDFGTGYSSLAYLRNLPVDELKLDQSFIKNMCDDDRARGIVGSIIDLAHSLGLRVVAEGVTNIRTSKALRALGCDIAQGFHFSKPLPAGKVPLWINTHTITSAHDDARSLIDPTPEPQ